MLSDVAMELQKARQRIHDLENSERIIKDKIKSHEPFPQIPAQEVSTQN